MKSFAQAIDCERQIDETTNGWNTKCNLLDDAMRKKKASNSGSEHGEKLLMLEMNIYCAGLSSGNVLCISTHRAWQTNSFSIRSFFSGQIVTNKFVIIRPLVALQ